MIPLFRSFLLFLSLPLQRILDLQHLQSDKVYAFKGLTADTQMCWCANSAICLTIRTANAELDEQDEVILLTLEGAIWRFLFCAAIGLGLIIMAAMASVVWFNAEEIFSS